MTGTIAMTLLGLAVTGPGRTGWVIAGYLAGTLPSAWLVATATSARALQAEAGRRAGETDPHVLMVGHLGWGWTILASSADVLKGLLFVLAARELGDLPAGWLAATGVSLVLGHTFPVYLRRWAGRGLAASAGVLLVLLPIEMTVAGVLIVVGYATHRTGILSTVAFVSVPVIAAVQGQPAAFVWMGVAILALLVVRRLEGVTDVVKAGVSRRRAVVQRVVFDVTARPPPEAEDPSG
jgi:acyl phosphate:glycerol-3-phosphate acyltransferase